ncbi:beta-ketoacyl synthase N-terminal-like domain-containing protein, partial [Burkholderia sp. Ac-20379]|uniref:beta-ketoacyl synthase N-terminal-like domain-containing protein n=1 Tax=Burkholderia sp. Ac-20379 TaxID=2703900 RepID=UPI001D823A05
GETAAGLPRQAAALAAELIDAAVRTQTRDALYPQLAAQGAGFGPFLEVLERAHWLRDGGLLCALRAAPPQQDSFKRNQTMPAALLGAAFQALLLAVPEAGQWAIETIATLDVPAICPDAEVAYLLVRPRMPAGGVEQVCDLSFLDARGDTVAAWSELRLCAPERFAPLDSIDGFARAVAPAPYAGAAVQPFTQAAVEVAAQSASQPATQPAAVAAHAAAALPARMPVQASTATAAAPAPALTSVPAWAQAPADAPTERERLLAELRDLAAGILKFPLAEINARAAFYDLGFDSISLTRFANEINARYGSTLTPAIFFECEHADALAAHLIARHGARPAASIEAAPAALHATSDAPAAAPALQSGEPSGADTRIAIVGMAARLPGAEDAEAFFAHLCAGRDLVGPLPLERYGEAYRARLLAAGFPMQGGFIDDIDRFDAAHFRISPKEAERLDPQQRLMLETAWRALEDAGYRAAELPRDTGVFVGVTGHDYASLLQQHGVEFDGFAATGNSLAMVANRISHCFDWHGPSQSVDTACSSSLVALLRAADALRAGRCGAALVGGVNLALSLEGFTGPDQAGMLSPAGRCKTFGKDADGYVRGEGVVVLLLKPLEAARRDGDRIVGVLAGGAENHGGHAGSLTAPNANAQAELVQRAMAGLAAGEIDYIETHGTGTSLGDPVEINGLRIAYRALLGGRAATPPFIGLGSVKSNIGHLEAAAGLAGVLKVLMAMRHGELPASLHCDEVNPYIELQDSPFYLVRRRQPWPRGVDAAGRERPRRAGVSSFGFGGANAHVVIEEALPA